jgi:tRNA(Ile)-lysidine synthase
MPAAATPAPRLVAVAASGGRDSTALLHCVVHQASLQGGTAVLALHVNHGLMPDANLWQSLLAAQVRRWARSGLPVQLISTQLQTAPEPGRSVEEWARSERYVALARMAQEAGACLVLLAQHRDDQVETVLLQALRGAGPAGLSGMPSAFSRHGMAFARPWLDKPGSAIQNYVKRFRLRHVSDPSNSDPRFDRSRLRAMVVPALRSAFPQADTSLQRVAHRAQEADACLRELAELDLAGCTVQGALAVEAWSMLSMARRRNALRHWLTALKRGTPTPHLIDRLAHELPGKRVGQWPSALGTLACHAGKLRLIDTGLAARARPKPALLTNLERPGSYRFDGWLGTLTVSQTTGHGALPQALEQVEVRTRQHGLQFQRAPGATLRGVKKEYQWAGVPAWQRLGPVVWAGEQLLFVAGLGMDARALTAQGLQAGRLLEWQPDNAPDSR